jgi:hypothetical protein
MNRLDLFCVSLCADVVGSKAGNGYRRCAMRQTQILRRPRRSARLDDLTPTAIPAAMDTSAAAALVETIDALVED